MTDEIVLSASAAHGFAREICQTIGIPKDDASIIADSMVYNAPHGRITHSLVRLDLIAKRARAGGLSLATDWTAIRQQGATTLLDAGHTWGVLAGTHGMQHAVARAKEFGVDMTSVRNCDNTGALSWYTSRAVKENLIARGAPIPTTTPTSARCCRWAATEEVRWRSCGRC
jgi:LDH2 family malate/lactate/ureidoglycolate dehydrogenase